MLRAKDAAHTCALLGYLYEQVRSGTLFAPTATRAPVVGGVTSKRRRDNVDPWQAMLMALPGMSAPKAAAVAAAYPSMGALVRRASAKELASLLVADAGAGTKTKGNQKKPRKLGPALAGRLVALH